MSRVILWIGTPISSHFVGKMGELLTVFDADVDLTQHPLNDNKELARRGYEVVKEKADLILACSEHFCSFFEAAQGRVLLVQNGVDIDRFAGPSPMPEELASIPRPIAGYVGVVEERIDGELLAHAGAVHRDVSFVVVGPILKPSVIEKCFDLPNFYFLGQKHPSQVPALIRHFDLCLIPHAVNQVTRTMDTMKFYEYLAAGKPVVSTPVPPVNRFEQFAFVAETKEKFAEGIGRTLKQADDEVLRRERIAIANENTWAKRGFAIREAILTALTEKSLVDSNAND